MRRISLSLALLLTGCVGADQTGATAQAVVDGTPDGVGLLALLNDPATTRSVLDDDVPLDSRAASGLIAHRDGADGLSGTADDDRFDDVAEVDAVKWVGEVSLERLVTYAAAHGYTPTGDDLLGTYDGVPFTVDEADRVLDLVNNASETTLHDDVPLDSRAVTSILAARPIASMPQLAGLYYVGTAMLQRLLDYTTPADPGRADCLDKSDCPSGWYCTGKPVDGSYDYGKCYDPTPIPGADASCDPTHPCGADLECLGVVVWGSGFCVPAWQRDQFSSNDWLDIPSTAGATIDDPVLVYGQATVPVDIQVYPVIEVSDPHALRVTLVSCNGDASLMWDGPNETGPMPAVLDHNCCIPSDDNGNGTWHLVVENVTGGAVGSLRGWTLDITSQWD